MANWDTIQGNWKQFRGRVQEEWGDLTDDDIDQIEGRRTVLVGRIQERYGKNREETEEEVRDWLNSLD